jgi:iron complex transport system permease protein
LPRAWRRFAVLLALLIWLAAALAVGLSHGSLALSMGDVLEVLAGDRRDIAYQVLWNVRLPRLLLGAMVGASLALSGTILQAVMRNALAAPNLIGVSAGGGLAAVAVMVAAPQFAAWLPAAAFAGAMASALTVYGLAWRDGVRPMHLVLSGIAVASLLGALTTGLLIFNADKVAGVLDFTVGSLSAKTWRQPAMVWPYMLTGILGAAWFARDMNILALGDDVATGLGLRVEAARLGLIAAAALLAAASVSVVGLLGFVGLIAPHITRLLIGSDHRYLLPAAGLFGAGLVMACDTVGRMILDPVELPVGVVMAVLGPPFFLYLLRRAEPHDA